MDLSYFFAIMLVAVLSHVQGMPELERIQSVGSANVKVIEPTYASIWNPLAEQKIVFETNVEISARNMEFLMCRPRMALAEFYKSCVRIDDARINALQMTATELKSSSAKPMNRLLGLPNYRQSGAPATIRRYRYVATTRYASVPLEAHSSQWIVLVRLHVGGAQTEAASASFTVLDGPEPLDGRLLECDFTKKSVIGTGQFGAVYRGKFLQPGAEQPVDVAIKEVAINDAEDVESFEREVQVMQSLDHENIIPVLSSYRVAFRAPKNEAGVSKISHLGRIVMPLATGGDVFYLLDDYDLYSHALRHNHMREIARQVSAAVAYMHSMGIMHRDLKPENILLKEPYLNEERDGKSISGPPKILLADFGLACMESGGRDCDFRRQYCGTLRYMAPELVSRSNINRCMAYSAKVDSYSLGVLIYTLFDRDFTSTKERGVIDLDADALRSQPIELRHLLSRLLERNERKRMSVSDVLAHPYFARESARDAAEPAAAATPSRARSHSARHMYADYKRKLSNEGVAFFGKQLFIKTKPAADGPKVNPVTVLKDAVRGAKFEGGRDTFGKRFDLVKMLDADEQHMLEHETDSGDLLDSDSSHSSGSGTKLSLRIPPVSRSKELEFENKLSARRMGLDLGRPSLSQLRKDSYSDVVSPYILAREPNVSPRTTYRQM